MKAVYFPKTAIKTHKCRKQNGEVRNQIGSRKMVCTIITLGNYDILIMQELCKNGGILSLAHSILRLRVPECFQHSAEIIASVSRFKAKILALVSNNTSTSLSKIYIYIYQSLIYLFYCTVVTAM